MPYAFGETIYDGLDDIKEFESIEEMKKYLCKSKNVTVDDIIIKDERIHKDERLGWEDKRYVCLKYEGQTWVIGYCATKYKNIEETINKLKKENKTYKRIKKY